MPHYLIQVAYSIEGWKALVKKPQNRIEAVRPAIERLGGKIESAWYAFGDYDVVLIVQMPSNVDAGAIAIAFAAGGGCKAVKTAPLLTIDEAVEAMHKAAGSEITLQQNPGAVNCVTITIRTTGERIYFHIALMLRQLGALPPQQSA